MSLCGGRSPNISFFVAMPELEIWPRKKWSLVKVYPCVDDSPHSNYGTGIQVNLC